jgi:hypothetical protein
MGLLRTKLERTYAFELDAVYPGDRPPAHLPPPPSHETRHRQGIRTPGLPDLMNEGLAEIPACSALAAADPIPDAGPAPASVDWPAMGGKIALNAANPTNNKSMRHRPSTCPKVVRSSMSHLLAACGARGHMGNPTGHRTRLGAGSNSPSLSSLGAQTKRRNGNTSRHVEATGWWGLLSFARTPVSLCPRPGRCCIVGHSSCLHCTIGGAAGQALVSDAGRRGKQARPLTRCGIIKAQP